MGMHLSSRTTTQPRVRHPTPLAEQRIWVTSRVPESLEGFLQAGHGEPGEGGGAYFRVLRGISLGIGRNPVWRTDLKRSRRALSRHHTLVFRNSACVGSKNSSKVAFWGCIVVIGRFLLGDGRSRLQGSLKVVPFWIIF